VNAGINLRKLGLCLLTTLFILVGIAGSPRFVTRAQETAPDATLVVETDRLVTKPDEAFDVRIIIQAERNRL